MNVIFSLNKQDQRYIDAVAVEVSWLHWILMTNDSNESNDSNENNGLC